MKVYNNTIAGSVISNDAGKTTIGKDGFLKLLAAELQNQDPLNAKDNTEYVAQMAQFSSLEQISSLNASMEQLVLNQKFQQGSLMIGKIAKILDGDGNYITGEVKSVRLKDGQINIIVDSKEYDIDNVVELTGKESETNGVSNN